MGPGPTRSGCPIVVGLVAGREKRKKQVPPDRTRDLRRLSGARRCARNDNSRALGRAGVEVEVMGTVRV